MTLHELWRAFDEISSAYILAYGGFTDEFPLVELVLEPAQ